MAKHTDKIELDEEYKNIETYKKLVDSQENEKILKTKIIGCLPNQDGTTAAQKWFAVGQFENYQVLIPGTLLGFDNIEGAKDKAGNPVSEYNKSQMYRAYIRAMLGAEIDFVVHNNPSAINSAMKMVVGNRALAMAKKRKSNYFKKDKDGKSKVERAFEAGEPLIGRVVSIASTVVFVEVYGYVMGVLARDVSWRYTENLRDVVSIGEQLHVKFTSLEIDKENETIKATVSIKEAQPNIMRENMQKYRKDGIYLGKISGARNGGYFVQIGNHVDGIDVYCKRITCPDTPHVGDIVSVRLFVFDEENARVFGSIEAVVEKKYSNFVS